jgi:hypothetical protein
MLFWSYMAAMAGLSALPILITKINKRPRTGLAPIACVVNLATVAAVICLYAAAGGWS